MSENQKPTEKRAKLYSGKYVVMQNKMIDAYHSFGLDEKRLLILASPKVRLTKNVDQDTNIIIKASDYANECKVDLRTAYKSLDIASKKLMSRQVYYVNDNGKKVTSQWIIRATYEDGKVIINFTKEAIILMQIFDKENPYTYFLKEVALELSKVHAVKLYEIFKKNEKLKTFDISVDSIIEKLTLPMSYRKMVSNIMVKVINPSLDQINERTDIHVECVPIIERSTKGYKFTVTKNIKNINNWKENPKHDDSSVDSDINDSDINDSDSNIIEHGFIKLTDSQIIKYSNEISRLKSIQGSKEPILKKLFESNLTYNEIAQKLAGILKHTINQKYLWEYLNELDFKYKGKSITVKKDAPVAPSEALTPQDAPVVPSEALTPQDEPVAPSEALTPQDVKALAINKLRDKNTFVHRASKLRTRLKDNDLWKKIYPDSLNYLVAMGKFGEAVKTDKDIEDFIKQIESYGETVVF